MSSTGYFCVKLQWLWGLVSVLFCVVLYHIHQFIKMSTSSCWEPLQLTAGMFPFSFQVCVVCDGAVSCGITSGAAVCVTWIFHERHRSSDKRCVSSRCVLRGPAIFPVTLRSAAPSGAGACSSVRLPKSCVWMHVKHKKQMWRPERLINLVLLCTCQNAEEILFFLCHWCWFSFAAKSNKWAGICGWHWCRGSLVTR